MMLKFFVFPYHTAAQDGPTDAFLVLNSSVRHLNWIADALKKL